jgi:hypothetical protein
VVSSLSREIEIIVAAVRATPGWRVDGGRHYKVYSPDGKTIVAISKTPGSPHRIKAYRAQFAKLGVDFRQGRTRHR